MDATSRVAAEEIFCCMARFNLLFMQQWKGSSVFLLGKVQLHRGAAVCKTWRAMAKHLGKDEFRRIMRSRYWLRGHFLVMLICTGLVTLAASHALLSMGLQNILIRYLICLLFSYISFLVLLRIWLGLYIFPNAHKASLENHVDSLDTVLNVTDWNIPLPNVKSQGGNYSGAGASGDWGVPDLPKVDLPSLDGLDDGSAPIVLPLMAIVAILFMALFFVSALGLAVYAAPAILCEIALEMALTIGIVRATLKENDFSEGYWLWTAMRKTILPFLGLIFAVMAGLMIALHYHPQLTKISELWALLF